MRKTNKIKKMTIAMGLAVAMTVGAAINAETALATTSGYLSAPTLSTSSTTGSYQVTVTSGSGSTNIYASLTSLYGNTIPSVQSLLSVPGITGPITSIGDQGVPVTYNPSSLDLQYVNGMISNYSATASSLPGDSINGQIQSDVFKIGSGATMSGAVPGELVFTYQFDVTSATPNSTGINTASLSFFNDPGNSVTYTLGAGINTTAIGPTQLCPTCTVAPISGSNLTGTVQYDPLNTSISTLTYNSGADAFLGYVSPQFFVASNALYYGIGSMALSGGGMDGGGGVFVPNTPEPATLVLFGTGLAFLGFMALRRKENNLNI